MTSLDEGKRSETPPTINIRGDHLTPHEIQIEPRILQKSRLPLTIALVSFLGLFLLIFVPPLISLLTGRKMTFNLDFGDAQASPIVYVVALYFPHILLFIVTLVSGYIGYRLIVASGANPENPIPPSNYALLAPLIQEGKSDAIDQYVRLSSLSGFTGTFTKLGLTGLPLTTVALTLIFAALALLAAEPDSQKSLFDLTKLTLGAFIGSFVQRQVEQRRTPGPKGDESRAPSSS